QKYCEQRDQKLKEGLGSWAGGMADTAAGAIGKGLGKVGNAAMTGIGHGIMQGAKRGWGTYTQGQGSNQTHNWGMMAQKAAMSGDPDQFASAAKLIYKQMKDVENPYLTGLNLSVNPAGLKIRQRVAENSDQVNQRWEDYMNNPEKYGTSRWRNYSGTMFPPEVVSAASSGWVTKFIKDAKKEDILKNHGNAALEQLQNQIFDISFRYGELKNLTKRLIKTGGISDYSDQEKIVNFVKDQLFKQKKSAKEMKNPEALVDAIKNSDGQTLCGIDQNGDPVFETNIYKAILESGKLWRMSQAITGINVDYRNSVDVRQRGTGGGQGEQAKQGAGGVMGGGPTGGSGIVDRMTQPSQPQTV
ncbi:MAG: hypothetical protein OPY06_05150, partial [Nitrosopumilus sp.]|nr:hypothetical protein [Nitrosopumilus sp.]